MFPFGFWADEIFVSGKETSFPTTKSTPTSALHSDLMQFMYGPLVSAGAQSWQAVKK